MGDVQGLCNTQALALVHQSQERHRRQSLPLSVAVPNEPKAFHPALDNADPLLPLPNAKFCEVLCAIKGCRATGCCMGC
jgi:hypothetical protein